MPARVPVRVPVPVSVLNAFSCVYEKILKKRVLNSPILVEHILLVLDETDLLAAGGLEKLKQFVKCCHALKVNVVTVYVSVVQGGDGQGRDGQGRDGQGLDEELLQRAYSHLREEIAKALSKENASIAIYANTPTPNSAPNSADYLDPESLDPESLNPNPEKKINISIGLGGRSELTKAIKKIMCRVQAGEVEPDEIDEKLIESELIFKSEPDLVIRSGATLLTDFLIWQSVYSEFYFTDVNWARFRKIDLLRAVRDFQWRERRFGR